MLSTWPTGFVHLLISLLFVISFESSLSKPNRHYFIHTSPPNTTQQTRFSDLDKAPSDGLDTRGAGGGAVGVTVAIGPPTLNKLPQLYYDILSLHTWQWRNLSRKWWQFSWHWLLLVNRRCYGCRCNWRSF